MQFESEDETTQTKTFSYPHEEQLLRSLIDVVPDYIFIKDKEGRFIISNVAHAAATGLEPDDLVGQVAQNVFPGDLAEQFHADDDWVVQTGQSLINQERITVDSNGNKRHVLTNKVPLRDEHGEIVGVVGVSRDITQRKNAEDLLRQEKEKTQKYLDIVGVILVALNTQGEITLINKKGCQVLGYTEAELIGENWFERCIPEQSRHAVQEVLQQIIAGALDPVSDFRNSVLTKSGEERIIAWKNAYLTDNSNRIIGVISSGEDITERERVEEELRKLSRATEQSANSIIITDNKGNIEYVNPKFTQVTGYSLAEVQGKNPRILKSGYTSDSEYKMMWQAITNGQEWRTEFRNRKKNGEFYWEIAAISPIKNVTGEITHFLATKEDITARKEAELALQKANSQLVMFNRVISVASSTLEVDKILEMTCRELKITFDTSAVVAHLYDKKCEKLTVVAECLAEDYPSAKGLELSLNDYPVFDYLLCYKIPLAIADAQHDIRLKSIQETIEQWHTISLLTVPLLIQGEPVGNIEIHTTTPHEFSEDEVSLAVSVAQIISHPLENSLRHRRVEDHNTDLKREITYQTTQLEHLYERMGAILNTANPLILIKSDGKINTANPAFYHLFTYNIDEVFGQHVSILAEPPDDISLTKVLQKIFLESDETPQQITLVARRKDGTLFDADVTLALITDGNAVDGAVGSIHDITHLKEVERMKDRFVSTVSHELRTPTASIMLSAETLKTHFGRMTDEQRLKSITRIDMQAVVLADLIESILDISRLDTRTKQRSTLMVNMNHLVDQIMVEFRENTAAKGHNLTLEVHESALMIAGEATDFARIWRNLLSNAVKYTLDGGQITATIDRLCWNIDGTPTISNGTSIERLHLPADLQAGEYLIGQVKDTGRGIPPEDVEQLFTRFYRGWASQSNIPGTGLGLALVRELLEFYDGGIAVHSELGTGSCFSFWLPITNEG